MNRAQVELVQRTRTAQRNTAPAQKGRQSEQPIGAPSISRHVAMMSWCAISGAWRFVIVAFVSRRFVPVWHITQGRRWQCDSADFLLCMGRMFDHTRSHRAQSHFQLSLYSLIDLTGRCSRYIYPNYLSLFIQIICLYINRLACSLVMKRSTLPLEPIRLLTERADVVEPSSVRRSPAPAAKTGVAASVYLLPQRAPVMSQPSRARLT